MVVNGSTMPAGEPVAPAAALGQTALKSGHSSALSRLPRFGSECTRAQYSAPKKAPKNITSEKMNQLMLQRNDDVDAVAVQAAFALADGLAEPLLQHEQPTARSRTAASTRPSRGR